jgi:uncharacterized NAD(P)/FAD-binding protein YdhS
VRDDSARPSRAPLVAVIGGGASGALTAVHLLRRAEAYGIPLRVALIDRYGRHGLGQAYATEDPRHLLNTCAAKMSALADDPGHLLRWARGTGLEVADSDFIPRLVYGRYLRELIGDRDGLTPVTGTVTALSRSSDGVWIELAEGGIIEADAAVLATGNRAPARWPHLPYGPRHVPDPWVPGALTGVGGDGAPALVIGTGLTMVDIAVTLTRAHPDTVVYALSRHGLLPREHRCPPPPPAEITVPDSARLGDLLRLVRTAIRDRDGDWHGVVDAVRPHVPRVWAGLSVADRRRFLSSVARYWEIHRHRIPPATAAYVAGLRESGRLRILRGRLVSAVADGEALTTRIETAGTTRDLSVGWLINGTGPAAEVTTDPFLAGLITAGLARPDPLRLGLDADETGAVLDAAGQPHDRIFALGPTLRGVRYETTAIPEIRTQAGVLAHHLVPRLASVGEVPAHPPARRRSFAGVVLAPP